MAIHMILFDFTVTAVLACCVFADTNPPSYTVQPADTMSVEKLDVTMYCSVADLGSNQVFWGVDQDSTNAKAGEVFTLGPNRNAHSSYQRFEFKGDVSKGEFNLRIVDLTASDSGKYTCLIYDPVLSGTIAMEADATLIVVADPALPVALYPRCTMWPLGDSSQPPSYMYADEDLLTLTCTSRGGVPLSELTWMRIAEDGSSNTLPSATAVMGDMVTTTASVKLSALDHQSRYMCIEEHPALPGPRNCTTPDALLNVQFKPLVSMTPAVIYVEVLETLTVTLRCTAEANPETFQGPAIVLPVNKSGVYSLEDRATVTVDITTDDVGKRYYCSAWNAFGRGEGVTEIIRTKRLPSWLIVAIIGGIGVVLLIPIIFVSCAFCIDRSKSQHPTPNKKTDPYRLRPVVSPDTGDGDFIEGFEEEDTAPIEDFQGGLESFGGEAGKQREPLDRFQNINEAFQMDDSLSNPSSTEAIINYD